MSKYYSIFYLSWNFSTFGGSGDAIQQIKAKDGGPLKIASYEEAELVLIELLALPEWAGLSPRFTILPVYEKLTS